MNSNVLHNNFYNIGPSDEDLGVYYESSFTTIFNEESTSVKNFRTISYSGTDSRKYIYKTAATGDQTFSLAQIQAQKLTPSEFSLTKGWYTNSITTDLQEGEVKEFLDKEGKYYNYIKGLATFFDDNCKTNVDSKEFNVQGIGKPNGIIAPPVQGFVVTTELDEDCFSGVVPPLLENQAFIVVEDIPASFSIAQSNTCSDPITFNLISNATTGGTLVFNNTGAFTFDPDLNYNGDAGSFNVVACCGEVCSEPAAMSINVTAVEENPYFTTRPPSTTGLLVGDVWTYNPIGIDDPDSTPSDLFIQTPVPNLPSWMSEPEPLNDGSGNWYIPPSTVAGANPIDFTMTVEDQNGNTGTQQITGESVAAALLELEFLITTREEQVARTYTDPNTSQVTVLAPQISSLHKCNKGTYKLVGNTTDIARAYVGNNSNILDELNRPIFDTYTLDENGYANSPTGDPGGFADVPSADAQGIINTRLYDVPLPPPAGTGQYQKYITAGDNFADPLSPYNKKERYNLITIDEAIADNIVSNTPGPNPEIVTFGLVPDTYLNNSKFLPPGEDVTHTQGVYLQIFKSGVEIYSAIAPNDSALRINVLTGQII